MATADTNTATNTANTAATNTEPVFQIQRVYLKDLSLEQPNSPAILLDQEQPSVDIQLGVEATPIADGLFEVCVTGARESVPSGSFCIASVSGAAHRNWMSRGL